MSIGGFSWNLNIFLNVEVSEVEIDEMFEMADTDRDGVIGFKEFMVIRRVGRKRSGRQLVSSLIPPICRLC